MTTTWDEAADLLERVMPLQAELEREQADWDWLAGPIRDRLCRAEDDFAATGDPSYRKDANVARRDLANLGPRPEESIGLATLKARLWRAEHREAGR